MDKVSFEMTLTSPEFVKMMSSSGLINPEVLQRIIEQGGGSPKQEPEKQPGMFGQMFKALIAVEALEKIGKGILNNSSVANSYLGSMGKMFGAAMDLLLIPFLPIFNLILAGMSKLIGWLITSGVLERIAGYVSSVVDWLKQTWQAVKEAFKVDGIIGAIRELAGKIREGIVAWFKAAKDDPKVVIPATIATILGTLSLARMGWGALRFVPGAQPLLRGGAALGARAVGGAAAMGGGGALGLAGFGLAALGAAGTAALPMVVDETIQRATGRDLLGHPSGYRIYDPRSFLAGMKNLGGDIRDLFGGGGGNGGREIMNSNITSNSNNSFVTNITVNSVDKREIANELARMNESIIKNAFAQGMG